MRLEHMINILVIHYTNFLTGIQMLNDGRLSIYILPKEEMQITLKNVQEDLENSDKGKFFRLLYENVDFYYRKGAFVFARDEENLYITIQIPVTNIHTDFKIYQVIYHKLTLHDGTKHSLELDNKVFGMAMSTTKDLYYEISEFELRTWNKYEHSIQRRIFRQTDQNACLIAIYMDNKQEVKKNCHYIIVMHDLKPEITYLYDNSYLFTNISKITYL